MNIGTLHDENSIHILNRIIIQTPMNDELKFDVKECLNDLCCSVVHAVDASDLNVLLRSNGMASMSSVTSSTINKTEPYTFYKNN